MKAKKTLKAIALSLGLAAMVAPATLDAQINHGLLQNPYKDESSKKQGMLRQGSPAEINDNGGITNQGVGEAPLGSGLAILIGAGLGYVALKKKEDER